MERFYLMMGFCTRTSSIFIPDPALFRTEEEAMFYKETHTNETIAYAYQAVRVGKFDKEYMVENPPNPIIETSGDGG